jgi:hypothetical protein
MAVHIYEPHALDLMTSIEGSEWATNQAAGVFGDNSFQVFKQAWELLPMDERETNPQFIIVLPSGACSIFGANGKNRYTVRKTGEILFLSLPALSQRTTQLASQLGFTVYPW